MNRLPWIAVLALLLGWSAAAAEQVLDGDIVFQDSGSAQTPAIQFATKSRYSHCGVVLLRKGEPCVFEAVSRVTFTPLQAWIKRGVDGHYVVMRLRDREKLLTPQSLSTMQSVALGFAGKPYDTKFLWGDDKLYCSELVWKVYERGAGVQLTALKHLHEYDLDHPKVKAKLKERFGAHVPLDESVVAPVDLLRSRLLVEVSRGQLRER